MHVGQYSRAKNSSTMSFSCDYVAWKLSALFFQYCSKQIIYDYIDYTLELKKIHMYNYIQIYENYIKYDNVIYISRTILKRETLNLYK